MKRSGAPELAARQHLAWASDFGWLCGLGITLLLLMYVVYAYDWLAGLGVIGALCLLIWGTLVFPQAYRATAAAVRHIGGLQFIVLLLFLSGYIQNFFPDIAIRDWKEVQQSPVNAVNLARTGLIGLAGVMSLCVAAFRSRGRATSFWGPLRWMFLYAAVAIVSSSYASLPLASAAKAGEVMTDVVCFLVLASLLYADDFLHSWNVLWSVIALLLGCVWVSAFLLPSIGFEQHDPPGLFPSLIGAFPQIHWNDLGQLGAGLAIVALCKLLRPGSRLYSQIGLFWGGICLFGLATIVAAEARTSIVALAVAVPICLYLYRRRTLLLAYFGLAGVAVLIAVYGSAFGGGAGEIVPEYLRRGETPQVLHSLTGRTDYWLLAWNSFLTSPLLGQGFYTAHRIDLNSAWGAHNVSNLDNTFLEVLLGIGIIGLCPLVMALVSLIRRSVQTLKRPPASSHLSAGQKEMLGFLTVALVRSATGPTFQVHGENLILLLVIMGFVQSICAGRLARPATA